MDIKLLKKKLKWKDVSAPTTIAGENNFCYCYIVWHNFFCLFYKIENIITTMKANKINSKDMMLNLFKIIKKNTKKLRRLQIRTDSTSCPILPIVDFECVIDR